MCPVQTNLLSLSCICLFVHFIVVHILKTVHDYPVCRAVYLKSLKVNSSLGCVPAWQQFDLKVTLTVSSHMETRNILVRTAAVYRKHAYDMEHETLQFQK